MYQINENYQKLPGAIYLVPLPKGKCIYPGKSDKNIIRLGIGDVTQPIAPAIIEALHKAVDEMADPATFHGYAPDLGYDFLRNAIVKNDYQARGCAIEADEIFVSDGAKCDSANIQELFGPDVKLRYVIRFTRFMWIPTLWQAEPVHNGYPDVEQCNLYAMYQRK